MFGSLDDLLLQVLTKIVEIIAVPCNPDNQVAIVFRVFLRITQGFGIDHVELDVVPVHAEITPDKLRNFPDCLVIIKKGRSKFLIQQSASGPKMVYFCSRFYHR